MPTIEVIFPKQRNPDPERTSWVHNETVQVSPCLQLNNNKCLQALSLMTEWSGMAYPLEKLTIVSAPISTYGVENFGLVFVQVPPTSFFSFSSRTVSQPTVTIT